MSQVDLVWAWTLDARQEDIIMNHFSKVSSHFCHSDFIQFRQLLGQGVVQKFGKIFNIYSGNEYT